MAFTDERDEALELLKTGEIEPLFEILGWDEPTHADLTYDNGSRACACGCAAAKPCLVTRIS